MRADARRRFWFAALLLLPLVFRDDLSRFALARVGTFAAAATGLSLVAGLAGQISLGHAGLMMAGAYTSAGLAVHAGWPFAAAWVAGTALAAAVGLVFGVPSLRVRRQYLALATLGGGFIIWQIVRETASLTGSDFGLAGVPPPSLFGTTLGPLGSAMLAMGLLALALFSVGNLARSRTGRAFRAVRDSETGAGASGISIYGTKLGAFVLSAAVAGAAGALFAHSEGFIAPGQFDPRVSFTLLLAAVLGGFASPYGGALGIALILGPSDLFPAAFDWLEPYQIVAWGPVALLVVFRYPEGVAGVVSRVARRVRARTGAAARMAPSIEDVQIPLAPPGVAVGEPFLVVRGLTRSFGGLRALHEVALDVRAGSIHALIGPNGSGKTTLLDCLTGVLRADHGEATLAGQRIERLPQHRVAALGVARTFQQVALFGSMTATEVVLTGAHPRLHGGIASGALGLAIASEAEAEARAILAAVGLEGHQEERAEALSYGQRKRLDLARALALRPALLLLDEPAAGRNEPEILELGRFLKRLRATGLTILLVEHHMNFVLSLADTVTVLDEGRVVAEGPPETVRADQAVIDAYLGSGVA